MAGKVAYILSRFPKISETFILREMIALQNKGFDIELYPLILEKQAVVHPEAKPWLATLHYFPWLSVDVLWANIAAFLRAPFSYTKLWGRMIFGNVSNPKFLARALLLFPKAVRMAEHMQKNDVQHIHAHFATHPALVAWIIHNLTGISYSVTAHAHDLYVKQTMLATKMQPASFVITISDFNRAFLKKHVGGQIEDKTEVVRCGIEQNIYAGNPNSFSDDRFYIKSIGSLQDYKGTRYLIEACALLLEQNIPIHCEVIGEGEMRHELEELIEELDVGAAVFLAGAKTQSEVAEALAKASCYVQPSIITETGKMEGIPVALMEALASGLPVIASDISGISELVRPEKTGYLVPEKDSLSLANVLTYIFEHSNEAKELAKVGQELVAKEYDLNINSTRVAALFEGFLEK
ncbi:MAG: colanic acid biosynthesis glycosyltransferase WcaL [Chloroflexi bacterium]|nr:colanic acid biosynthesis glycosyltransferase WcaL [Chloroflexota bacterium]